MSNEWRCRRTTRCRLHHWRFDFHKLARIKIVANSANDLSPFLKNIASLVIHHQVKVALTIPRFRVRKAGVLFGKRTQRFRQKSQCRRMHRQLALISFHHIASYPDNISYIPATKIRIDFLTHIVLTNISLNFTCSILQRNKACFAHCPSQHDPTGYHGLKLLFSQSFFGIFSVLIV